MTLCGFDAKTCLAALSILSRVNVISIKKPARMLPVAKLIRVCSLRLTVDRSVIIGCQLSAVSFYLGTSWPGVWSYSGTQLQTLNSPEAQPNGAKLNFQPRQLF